MDEQLLRELAENYLLPLFSGARIEPDAQASTEKDDLVAFSGPRSIAFKVDKGDKYRLVMFRVQPFQQSGAVAVAEIDVIRAFVEVAATVSGFLATKLKSDILLSLQRRVVARSIYGSQREDILLAGIDQLTNWGSKLYEGSAISSALGFRFTTIKNSEINLQAIGTNDFGSVLSNGYDTILEFNFKGEFVRFAEVAQTKPVPSYCPFRQGPVAEWTTQHEQRIAMVLNRLGEILIFRKHQLLFARRAGAWHFLTHDSVIRQMGLPVHGKTRTAIYETCLDASFARTGACIGVVSAADRKKLSQVVKGDDLIATSQTPKACAIRRAVFDRKFVDIDRRVRQELVAIDGATVLSHEGDILAVGAILTIPGGSHGGGRRAAAEELSKLGLGIKVSQDGGITGFRASNRTLKKHFWPVFSDTVANRPEETPMISMTTFPAFG